MLKGFLSEKRYTLKSVILITLVIGGGAGYLLFKPSEESRYIKFLYDRSAQYHRPDRNPIIVIPGILGSRLVDQATGLKVWGAFNGVSADPKTTEGARLLSLPINNTSSCDIPGSCLLKNQKDTVEPDGVLDEFKLDLFGLPVGFQAYANILATLGAGGYRDPALGLGGVDYGSEHFTCFQFSYDWRRDNIENAKQLRLYIDEKKMFVREQYKKKFGIDKADIKFDIVAHSMGGLLARYFLRYGGQDVDEVSSGEVPWAGAKDIERLILVGTPNAGSVDSYVELVEGFDAGTPVLPYYQAALLGTYPSIYQLLPRPRHKSVSWGGVSGESSSEVDLYDPKIWKKYGWGLASESEETENILRNILPGVETTEARREIALGQQARVLARAKQFHELIDKPAAPPAGVEIFLVAGDVVETLSGVKLDPQTGHITKKLYSAGDGSVLRSSALMDERVGGEWKPQLESPISWSSVLFMASDHLGLTKDPVFEDNVLFWLLEDQRSRLK